MQGATAFEQVHRRVYRSALMPFASLVLLRASDAPTQPKLEPRWQRGLWLGRKEDSDEHLVGTVEGVEAGRSCKVMEGANLEELMKEMRWTPWNPRAMGVATEESVPMEPKLLVKLGTTYEAPASRRKAARELQAFHAKCGRTTGCSACMYGPDGRSHSVACKARRRAWIDEGQPAPTMELQEEETGEAADMDIDGAEAEAQRKRRMEGEQEEQPGPLRRRRMTKAERRKAAEQLVGPARLAKPGRTGIAKRARDPALEEQWMAEEELARTARSAPGAVAALTVEGPPWYDEYTGIELLEEEVNNAMDKEMKSLAKFDVKTDATAQEMKEDGEAILVPARWLIHRKATGVVKVRLVAQQVNDGSLQDTFAATPSSVGQRRLLLKSAERAWPVALGDASTALLHAPLGPEDHVYLQPPPST